MKLILTLALLVPSMGAADLKDYEHPLVLKPFIIRDGSTITSDMKHWIPLPWKDFIAIGNNRLLFNYEGVVYTCPMKGYICLQEDG